jgi:(1->4)-alpha-D-glucan 1-alpha-D-glucosylmutase
VRAIINALSEIPDQWEKQIKEWSRINRRRKRRVKGLEVPDRNDEYFLYQTLVGAWPFEEREFPAFVKRIKDYAIKAVREAKVHTAWLKPDGDYEDAYLSFLDDILKPGNPFLEAFLPFQKKVAHCAVYTGLSQTLIKITSPGIPDFYQGGELWDLSLVDPDNRRPVDYGKRKAFLKHIKVKLEEGIRPLIGELLSTKEDGRIKLYLIHQALKVRREDAPLFQEGDYVPFETAGPFKDHVVAFGRCKEGKWIVTVAPRFFLALAGEGNYPLGVETWKDTALLLPEEAPHTWRNAMTGEQLIGRGRVPVAEILGVFPVALLTSEGSS